MSAPLHEFLAEALPNLTAENYRVTSAPSWEYNCIAWALGISDSWWWPVPGRFWPENIRREETFEAFEAMFVSQGYSCCMTFDYESGFEKIALYAKDKTPTHAARQVANGWWTSKLGPNLDIEHTNLDALAGGVYGTPVLFFRRSIAASLGR